MAWRATIGGVDHTADLHKESGVAIELPLNERASASFTCLPGYVPARFAEVVLYDKDGSTPIFGGVVLSRAIHGVVFGATPMYCAVTCGDYATYADWCYTTQDYTSGPTLKAVLQDLIADNLTAYGITLHASQATGPTLGVFAWDRKRVSDALRELSDRTGYVWRIDASKQLRMVVPGTDAAPVTLTDAGPNCRDLAWRDTDDQPANAVTLVCGQSGVGADAYEQVWTADGVDRAWAIDGLNVPASATWPGVVWIDSGSGYAALPIWPAGMAPGGNGIEWDYATAGGTLSFVGTETTPASGTLLKIIYYPQFPFTVTATSGATPIIEYQAAAPDVLTLDAAGEMADGLLDQLNQQPRELSWLSDTAGWAPGQLATIDLTGRAFDATAIITAVSIRLVSDTWWEYTCQAVESATYTGSYLDQWRELTGGSSSGVTTISGSGGGSSTSSGSPFPLGGSRSQPLELAMADWFAVPEWERFDAPSTGTVRLKVDLWAMDAGVGVWARLYCLTDSAQAGDVSAKVTNTTPEATTWSVAVTAGKDYCLQIKSDTNAKAVFGIGGGRYL